MEVHTGGAGRKTMKPKLAQIFSSKLKKKRFEKKKRNPQFEGEKNPLKQSQV